MIIMAFIHHKIYFSIAGIIIFPALVFMEDCQHRNMSWELFYLFA